MTPSASGNPLHAAFYADRACQLTTAIVENVELARDTFKVRFNCPEIARRILPGQFMMLRLSECNDPLLGRPLALFDTVISSSGDPIGLDLVYLAAGKFTRQLANCRPGRFLDVWGPLGNGFSAQAVEHLIMVAGGIGQTPFLALAAEQLGRKQFGDSPRNIQRPQKVTLCYGARSAAYFAGLEDFHRLGIEIQLSTDDGSRGHHGLVTDVLQKVLDESRAMPTEQNTLKPLGRSGTQRQIICCGPERMMEAVAEMAKKHCVPCQVSLETPMACGIGICFTCVAKVRQPEGDWDYKRTCIEGPVFDAAQIVW